MAYKKHAPVSETSNFHDDGDSCRDHLSYDTV
jgi:hypothetical protein